MNTQYRCLYIPIYKEYIIAHEESKKLVYTYKQITIRSHIYFSILAFEGSHNNT